jgi:hypothetical protein
MPRRTAFLIGLVLVITIAGVIALTRHKSGPVIPSTNPLAAAASNTHSSSSTNSPAATQSPTGADAAASSGPPPVVPSGNFVSNHHPGGGNPTSEASTCNTTAGATCYIQFTKGSTVKKLNTETTDARGAAIWYWDVNTAGLSSGSWIITAVATLNGQTKTANDAQPLIVQ